jgi:hypothetical protein
MKYLFLGLRCCPPRQSVIIFSIPVSSSSKHEYHSFQDSPGKEPQGHVASLNRHVASGVAVPRRTTSMQRRESRADD